MNEIMTKEEQQALAALTEKFVSSLPEQEMHGADLQQHLCQRMHEQLPDLSEEEIKAYALSITDSVSQYDSDLSDLRAHCQAGKSKSGWLHSKLQKAVSFMPAVEQNAYFTRLDQAMKQANEAFERSIHTQSGAVNQNPNLDGCIAEQYHAQTFNLDAAAKKLTARADVPQVNGKNSMDIGVRHTPGGTPDARFQLKYGKTAAETIKMIRKGDYRNQQLIVPSDQVEEVQAAFPNRKVSAAIDFDGAQGKPLSKAQAKELQEQAQKSKDVKLDWNEYSTKVLAKELCEQSGKAALIGAVVGATFEAIGEKKNGEKIKVSKVAEAAFKGGADAGVKCMAAGALKVAVERGLLHAIPKGTPASIITAIAYAGIENAKVAYKIFKGECTVLEGLGMMQDVTLSTAGGVLCAAEGAVIGAEIGGLLGSIVPGPGNVIGAAVGGFLGGTIGYMAGSAVGKAVSTGLKKLGKAAVQGIKKMGAAVLEKAQALSNAFRIRKEAWA